jgi:hypothetical protein
MSELKYVSFDTYLPKVWRSRVRRHLYFILIVDNCTLWFLKEPHYEAKGKWICIVKFKGVSWTILAVPENILCGRLKFNISDCICFFNVAYFFSGFIFLLRRLFSFYYNPCDGSGYIIYLLLNILQTDTMYLSDLNVK